MKNARKIDLENYTKGNARFVDNEWWYYSSSGTYRERVVTHARKNTNRMFVGGKFIPKYIDYKNRILNPLHKPGNYKSLDDAFADLIDE